MIHQISIHVISIHGLCLKFITLSCQLTFCQPSFPASVPVPPEKQKTPWNLWLCSTYTWPKRGTYQRGLLPIFTYNDLPSKSTIHGSFIYHPRHPSTYSQMMMLGMSKHRNEKHSICGFMKPFSVSVIGSLMVNLWFGVLGVALVIATLRI